MKSRCLCVVTLAVVMTASVAAALFADSLSGRVVDPQGRAVPNARLNLFNRRTGEARLTTSSSLGDYAFTGIPSGDYLLEAEASSLSLLGSRNVTIRDNRILELELGISAVPVEVLVTASSTPLSVEEVAKAIDVIDSGEIALRDELSIAEALRSLPGVRVQTLEGPGSFTTLQTRGLRASDTAVLVDGMRFRDAASTQGDATAFLGSMTTVDTDRIEFLRGSGSSLYGSHAVAGVVNLISRRGSGRPHGEVRLEGGGLGLIRGGAGVGGGLGDDRLTYSGSASHVNVTKGVRDGNPYRNTAVQGTLTYRLTPDVLLTGRLWVSHDYLSGTESPAFTPEVLANFPASDPVPAIALPTEQLERFEEGLPFNAGTATFIPGQMDRDSRRVGSFLSGAITLQHQVSSGTSYRVAYQRVATKRSHLDGPLRGGLFEPVTPTESRFDGHVDTVQARVDSDAGTAGFFSVGYELERESYFDSSGNQGEAPQSQIRLEQYSQAAFFQDQLKFLDGRLSLTVGGRAQYFSLREPSFSAAISPYAGVPVLTPKAYTGDVAVAYFLPNSRTKIRAHIGTSYRSPSAYERYGGSFSSFSDSFSYWGDPRLRPERSVGLDAGVDQWLAGSRIQLSATLFYTDLQEIIIFDFSNFPVAGDPFGRFGGYRNGEGRIARGVELSVQAAPSANTNLRAAYTYTNSDSSTPTIGTDFHQIPGLSDHTFTLTATQWFARRFHLTFDLFAVSDYSLSPFGAEGRRLVFDGPIKGDVVFGFTRDVGTERSIEFYTKVENLLNNRHYEQVFLGPGVWAISGIRFDY